MLEVSVLGPTAAAVDGQPLALGGPKQRAILALLALAGEQPVPAAALIGELWAAPPRNPAHALQAHISRLRAILPAGIELDAGGYRIRGAQVDAHRFLALHEQARALLAAGSAAAAADLLREALALWRGEPLADLPAGGPLAQAHSIQLAAARRDALADRIDADIACRNLGPAIAELPGLIAAAPLEERHRAQLMTALHLDGRQIEALEEHQRTREAFAEQLGAEPGERIARIHLAILRGDPLDNAPAAGATLIGRAPELAVLARAWSEAESGLRVVTITGEPGIGKSRLAAEFAAGLGMAGLGASGIPVLDGHCDSSVEIAYRPFLEMVRADLAALPESERAARLGPHLPELTRLLPELAALPSAGAGAAPASDPATEQFRVLDAFAGWLSAISRSQPVCLVLEDLHWADPETLVLLDHLRGSSRPMRVLLLVTLRDREGLDDGMDDPRLTPLLRQSEQVTHVPLTGMRDADVARLLAAELSLASHTVPDLPAIEERVIASAGGNPLFVIELARQIASTDLEPAALPAGLRAVVGQRLGQLPADVFTGLERAAVLGRTFDPMLLADMAGCDADEIDGLLVLAQYARLTQPAPGPLLRHMFCHDVIRSALYDGIAPLRRAALHRDAAEAIERRHGSDNPAHHPALGHHYAQAAALGPAEPAVRYLRLAGQASMAQRAPAVAVDAFRRALELLSGQSDPGQNDPGQGDPGLRCDLLVELGDAEFLAGHAEYRETLLAAARLAHELGDHRRLTAAAVANNRGWYSSTSEIDHERIAVIEAALATHDPDDRYSKAQLLAAWAVENVRDPALREEALARSAKAFDLAQELAAETGDEVLLAHQTAHRFSVLYASFSEPYECLALAERLYELAHRRADPGIRLNAAIAMAQITLLLGDFAASDRALADAAALAESLHHLARAWLARSWQATRAAVRGDLAGAEALALESLEIGIRTTQPDALTWFAGQLFVFRAMAGRLGEILDTVEEQVVEYADAIPAWRAAYAYALAEVGRRDEAAAIVAEFAARDCRQLPVDMLWLHGMSYLAMTCGLLDAAEHASGLYPVLAPHAGMVANNGTIDAGPVDLHLGTLARLRGESAAAATHLGAAADLCLRADAPLWGARVREQQTLLPSQTP